MDTARPGIMGVYFFQDLRAWQMARTFKLAVYRQASAGGNGLSLGLRH